MLAGDGDAAGPAARARWTGGVAADAGGAEEGAGRVGGAGVARVAGGGAAGVRAGEAAPPRGPEPREAPDGAPRVPGAVAGAGLRGPCAAAGPPRAPGTSPAGAAVSAGIARSGATGIRCTGAVPCTGRTGAFREAEESKAPDRRLSPAAGFSTAGDGAPVNDGFCHVGRRPPKPASATPARAAPVARWIGGRPVQAATAVRVAGAFAPLPASGPSPASGSGRAETTGDAVSPPPPSTPSRRPRSRSRNPTDQPSAVPRVTRDAIWSVYRRRSWCSRSRIASRLQWKW
ncbi:hypothetical protein GCM10010220_65010 [Streptomyces parvulus]|nr:hypothetical protein GCM10010220_65010 [Streptomyces parvulus]